MMDGYEGRDMCVLVMLKFRKLLNANGFRAVKEHSLFAMNIWCCYVNGTFDLYSYISPRKTGSPTRTMLILTQGGILAP